MTAAGDFVAADELPGEAALLQEADLGPLHPDLARTLNNLAIVAEKTGQTADAGVDWRVEVRSASGDLLHERRFPVR